MAVVRAAAGLRVVLRGGRPLQRTAAATMCRWSSTAAAAESAPPASSTSASSLSPPPPPLPALSSSAPPPFARWPDFVPRQKYEPSMDMPRSYFLGHHRAALDRMRRELAMVGLVIECRDLRVPLTAWNPLLETSLASGVVSEEAAAPEEADAAATAASETAPGYARTGGVAGLAHHTPTPTSTVLPSAHTARMRILVYTKRDLVTMNDQNNTRTPRTARRADGPASADLARLARFHRHEADAVLFMGAATSDDNRHDATARREMSRLLAAVRAAARRHGLQSLTDLRALVVGMPNAGKSTLLNRLRARGMTDPARRSRVARTGAQPGVTRKLGTPVRILGDSPSSAAGSASADNLLLVDTPGVFVPYVPHAESMLKLALVGCVREGLVPPVVLADYLLFHLNRHDPALYVDAYRLPDGRPTTDILTLLDAVARRTGKLARGGLPVHEAAALHLIHAWRRGRLGRFCLDAIDQPALDAAREAASSGLPLSLSQARKREKERRKARSIARHNGDVIDGEANASS